MRVHYRLGWCAVKHPPSPLTSTPSFFPFLILPLLPFLCFLPFDTVTTCFVSPADPPFGIIFFSLFSASIIPLAWIPILLFVVVTFLLLLFFFFLSLIFFPSCHRYPVIPHLLDLITRDESRPKGGRCGCPVVAPSSRSDSDRCDHFHISRSFSFLLFSFPRFSSKQHYLRVWLRVFLSFCILFTSLHYRLLVYLYLVFSYYHSFRSPWSSLVSFLFFLFNFSHVLCRLSVCMSICRPSSVLSIDFSFPPP